MQREQIEETLWLMAAVAVLVTVIIMAGGGCAAARKHIRPMKMSPTIVHISGPIPHAQSFKRAVNYWNCVMGTQVFGDIGLSRLHVRGAWRLPADEGKHTLAHVNWKSNMERMITVAYDLDALPARTAEQVYRHELGHVLGLPHGDPYMGDVMQPSVFSGESVYDVPADMLEALWDIYDVDKPPYDIKTECWNGNLD